MDKMDKECAYDFSHEKRGIALLIHNEEYGPESGFKNRPGDNEDFKHMLEIFKELEFDVHPYRNLTSTEISKRAKEVSEMSKIHEKSDCFACVIASHGEEIELETEKNIHIKEHVIVGIDGQVVKTRDIVEMFNADNCKELKDKPKFFFIQACRTSNATVLGMDSGHTVTITEQKQPQGGIVDGIENMQADSQIIDKVDANCISTNANSLCENNLDTRHLSSAEQQVVHQVTDVECPDDTLLMFASLSRNYAVRNPTNGSWLLTSLYSQIKEHIDTGKICSTEFMQILNGVLKEMTTKNFKPSDTTSRLYGAFSPGCYTHCLSRDVLFLEKQYK
ncbi:caspase-7-like [Mytilus californianus]|uniref:caspase-7-like n=1 Tax=Mytilus californianus TaxID=6549 RepID=UPI002247AC67|nr:caspase-7-like [Mytilus californianus]